VEISSEGRGERIGGYQVVRRLATGGMSEVLLARPDSGPREVVLKVLLSQYQHDDVFKNMFAREATAYARLSHPSIVHLYEFLSHEERLVMVLEYVDGPPLNRLRGMLKAVGQHLDDATSIHVASTIFDALAAAHGATDEAGLPAPVIHRDVNPSNVLVPWDGDVKLADFGIAKVTGTTHDSRAGLVKGTYGYMAPEQVKGEAVTPRADVYAAGIILWELLARRRAFHRGALPEVEVLRAMAEPRIASLDVLRPDLDRTVREAVGRALAPRADDRTVTAEEMVSILRAIVGASEGRERLRRGLALVRHEPRPATTAPPPRVEGVAPDVAATEPIAPRPPPPPRSFTPAPRTAVNVPPRVVAVAASPAPGAVARKTAPYGDEGAAARAGRPTPSPAAGDVAARTVMSRGSEGSPQPPRARTAPEGRSGQRPSAPMPAAAGIRPSAPAQAAAGGIGPSAPAQAIAGTPRPPRPAEKPPTSTLAGAATAPSVPSAPSTGRELAGRSIGAAIDEVLRAVPNSRVGAAELAPTASGDVLETVRSGGTEDLGRLPAAPGALFPTPPSAPPEGEGVRPLPSSFPAMTKTLAMDMRPVPLTPIPPAQPFHFGLAETEPAHAPLASRAATPPPPDAVPPENAPPAPVGSGASGPATARMPATAVEIPGATLPQPSAESHAPLQGPLPAPAFAASSTASPAADPLAPWMPASIPLPGSVGGGTTAEAGSPLPPPPRRRSRVVTALVVVMGLGAVLVGARFGLLRWQRTQIAARAVATTPQAAATGITTTAASAAASSGAVGAASAAASAGAVGAASAAASSPEPTVATVASSAAPVASAPLATGPVASTAASAVPAASTAAPAASAVPSTHGRVHTTKAAPGRRIFVDGVAIGQTPDAVLVKCGPHGIKLGSTGSTQSVEVPCGAEITLGDR